MTAPADVPAGVRRDMPPISAERPKSADALSLEALAARIIDEHREVLASAKRSLKHALAAGDLLLQAKEVVKYGEWLPWLRDNCPSISERTAQLYMRLAKNRAQLESATAQCIADLTLNAAAALVTGGSASAALYLASQAPSVISPTIPRDDDDGVVAKIEADIAHFAGARALRIKRLPDKHPTPSNTPAPSDRLPVRLPA